MLLWSLGDSNALLVIVAISGLSATHPRFATPSDTPRLLGYTLYGPPRDASLRPATPSVDAVPNDATPAAPSVITRRAVKMVLQERRAHQELLVRVGSVLSAAASEDYVSSPLHQDLVWVSEAESDYTHALETARVVIDLLTEGMGEWVDGFARLLQAEAPLPTQAAACLRGLLESVLLGSHLLEPGIATQQRLARFASCILNETQQAARIWGKVDGLAQASDERWTWRDEEVQDQLAMGFSHDWTKDGKRVEGVRLGEERSNLKLNVTALANKVLPDNEEFYPLLSSHAHAGLWSSHGNRTADPEVAVGTVTLQFLRLSLLWTQVVSDYFGIDASQMLVGTERRHRAMTPRQFQ